MGTPIRRCDEPTCGFEGMLAGGLAARSVNRLFQVCLPSSRLRVGVPIAGGPVASCFMQRVEHAMGPTPGVFGSPLLWICNGWIVTTRHA
jgi:hypothetical protein